jgi:hypothetical protein
MTTYDAAIAYLAKQKEPAYEAMQLIADLWLVSFNKVHQDIHIKRYGKESTNAKD